MAVPLFASSPPTSASVAKAGALVGGQMLDDVDSLADDGSVGHWTAVAGGGSVARNAPSGWIGWNSSVDVLTIGSSADGDAAALVGAIPANRTFKAGHRYQMIFVWRAASTPSPGDEAWWQADLGLIGVDASAETVIAKHSSDDPATGNWRYYSLVWAPVADYASSSVEVRFTRQTSGGGISGSFDLDLTYVQIFELPRGYADYQIDLLPLPTAGKSIWLQQNNGNSARLYTGHPSVHGPVSLKMSGEGQFNWQLGNWYNAIQAYRAGVDSQLYMYAEHTPGDLTESGLNIEIGDDYVGLYISEKDSDTLQFYADYSAGYMFELRDRGTDKGWVTANEAGTYSRRLIHESFQWTFHKTGAQTVATAINEMAEYLQAMDTFVIDEVRIHVGTAPTGATLIVDVNINGTTVFTTQANRPAIAISGTDAASGAADGGQTGAKNDRISVDVDQVGSTIAGSDLTVMVRGRYTH